MKSPEIVATTQTCVGDQTYVVTVTFQPSRQTRCLDFGCNISYFLFSIIVCCLIVALVVTDRCHRAPGISLQTVSIRDMTVYQNTTVCAPDLAWLVSSDFNLTLSTWSVLHFRVGTIIEVVYTLR
uniref:Uncharacterized protein n=1 Tax=Physcomitrium patens TaxID=3218 RepID=A0A2K1II53_PHYPA|nr:hypothetical protein PHYPA_027648 [Physcomitrium patens]